MERAWGRETPAPNNFFKGQRPWKLSECSAELTAGLATSQCSFMSPFRTAKVLKMKMLPAREISLLLTACAGEARHFTEGPRTKQTRLLNELSTPKPEAAEGLIKGAGKSRMKVSAEAKGKTLGEVKGKKILEHSADCFANDFYAQREPPSRFQSQHRSKLLPGTSW